MNQKKTFETLKKFCLEKSILKMFDLKKSLKFETHVSNLIIKTYLNQKYDDKWHFVTYYLKKKLSSIEQNYDIHDKKLLAIIYYWSNEKYTQKNY